MTRFIALLALVSGLLLVESKADVTKEWCVQPKEPAVEEIGLFLSNRLPVESLNEFQSQAFLRAARLFIDIPEFPGVTVVVAMVPGKGARGYLFKDDKYCARLTLPWASFVHAYREAMGKDI